MKKVLTITLALTALIGLIATGTITAADFDGDSRDDIAIFRPSTGLWAIRDVTRVYFGGSTDDSAAGDYNGDGIADIGIFRDSSGLWAIRDVTRVYFGGTSDIPVVGGGGGQRLYDYVVKADDGEDLVTALESITYRSVFIPAGTYIVNEAIDVENVQLILGAGVGNTIISFTTDGDYLGIGSNFCKVEGIYFLKGGDTTNNYGTVYITADYVTIENCRSYLALEDAFEYPITTNFVSFIDCFASSAARDGFQGISSVNSSRLVNCVAFGCGNSGFNQCNNISNGYVDGDNTSNYGFLSCNRISSSYVRDVTSIGFYRSDRISGCEVDGAGNTLTGFHTGYNISATRVINCTGVEYFDTWNTGTGTCN